ncbi:MAG TPA: ABC transporter ATP-binding protein [Vicinamibacterales bacterium]|nr:ABC transporter ATP-binding protein [Vicinamibacterales bacterium]
MLVVTDLHKSYATPRGPLPILDRVSLTLNQGEAAAIMGPSGSGKSTLLYVLGALEPPTSGSVSIDGTDPYALGERDQAAFRGARIGFVFQDHLLLPQLSAIDNVLAPTVVARDGGPFSDRARLLLTRVGLGDRMDHRPAELSGGERQRVAVARALIRQPALVLCDEPTGNLDRTAAEGVADVLADLATDGRTTVVVVTHSPSLAARFGRRYEVVDRTLIDLAGAPPDRM